MQEAFEKIKERMEELYDENEFEVNSGFITMCMDAVKQVAEEFGNSEQVCEWMQDDGATDIYDTKCGNTHMFIDGNPKDNKYEFCPYCGKKIKVVE